MIDKILMKNDCEVIIYYTTREPFTLHKDTGNIMEFLDEFLAPLGSEAPSLSEHNKRAAMGMEDTVVIGLEEVA